MVGDITYIPTWEGWLFLATVIDCATRKVAGWAMDDNYRTPLITAAIEMAARNLDLPADAVFHSDRGSNYTSAEFAAVLGRLGIRQSVGRTGICFDNSLAESFNAALKVERVHRTAYPTRKKAREDIARYIELRYNRTRLHSALGYRTPQEALDEYLNRPLADEIAPIQLSGKRGAAHAWAPHARRSAACEPRTPPSANKQPATSASNAPTNAAPRHAEPQPSAQNLTSATCQQRRNPSPPGLLTSGLEITADMAQFPAVRRG